MNLPDIMPVVGRLHSEPKVLWSLLNDSGLVFELHPIIQAIFQESINMLEIALAKYPEAATEKTYGVTTIQLCVYWPMGLQKLLSTKAVNVLDERALYLAVLADCVESVDLLFKAGCPVNYYDRTAKIFDNASERCMVVIASNLARRRLDLLSLAQQQQVICQDLELSSDIPDDQASYICSSLDNAGIGIPLELRVPSSYSTIYKFCGTTIYHYPILFENGFTQLSAHDIFGLLPTMMQPACCLPPYCINAGYGKLPEVIDWLESQGIMHHTPTDPLNLGLNIQATGWHYQSNYSPYFYARMGKFCHGKTKNLLTVPVLDNCRCWCTPSDRGCSPLITALKSCVEVNDEPEPLSEAVCAFLHTAIRDTGSSGLRITSWCIEVIRFLTFEALEMTHTCCEFTMVDEPDISPEECGVLMNCDPERWQKIRSDKREQENAALLETLMEGFIAYMIHMNPSPRSLEIFVHGYWRQRISEIYAVDLDEMEGLENYLVGTNAYVLPDRVRALLGEEFKLVELQNLKSEPTAGGEIFHDEKVESGDESFKLLPCRWCC